MRGKKKKGNALLLLLAMILMITVMGGTITTAIAYTTKQNVNREYDEDLLYAAESGIEYALAKIKGDGKVDYTINSIPSLVYKKISNVKVIIGSKVLDTVQLESIATSTTGKTRTVKAKVSYTMPTSPPGALDILFNSFITSGAIDLNATGSIMMGDTNITTDNSSNVHYPPSETVPANKPNTVQQQVQTITFNSQIKYKPNLSFTSIKGVSNSLNSVGKTFTGEDIDMDGKGDIIAESGVGKFQIQKPADHPIDVYFANTDKLTINYPSTYGAVENKFVIVCSGDVEIKIEGTNTINLDTITIYAKSVKFETASTLTVGTPILKKPSAIDDMTDPLYGANHVSKDNVLFLEKLLKLYSTNYGLGSDGSGGTGGTGGSPTISIVNGSYQYN